MRLYLILILIIISSTILFSGISSQSLEVIDSITIVADDFISTNADDLELYFNGIYISHDTIIVSLSTGIFLKTIQSNEWIRLISAYKWTETWWNDFQNAKKHGAIFSPANIRPIPNSHNLMVFDDWISGLYSLDCSTPNQVKATFNGQLDSIAIVNKVKIYDDIIIHNLIPVEHDTLLAISKLDGTNYSRFFTPPKSIIKILDSLGADYYSHCAFNSTDSTLLFVFKYYNRIYELDFSGNIIDSILITDPGFKVPKPPRSRIQSLAVLKDWLSKCTGIRNLCYAYPDKILLQYKGNWDIQGKDSTLLNPTLVWKTDKTPINVDVDKTWRLIQTLPDGQIIFVKYYQANGKNVRAVIYITRIES